MKKTWFVKFGNSRVSFWDGEKIQKHFSLRETSPARAWLTKHVSEAFGMSVISDPERFFPKSFRNYSLIEAQHIPVTPAYKKGLGVDRLLNAYSAQEIFPHTNLIVIDCGTAVCVDFVSADRKHLGGWIGVGAGIAAEALHSYTSALPLIKPRPVGDLVLGASSRESLQIGFRSLLRGYMEEALRLAPQIFSSGNFRILVTGGWASLVEWPKNVTLEPKLTLLGLKKLWESRRMKV